MIQATIKQRAVPKQKVAPLGPRDAGIPLTLDEFEEAEFVEGYRYELIHGVLVVSPPPLEQERDSNEELGHWLRNYRESHPEGKALDLTLPEHNIRTRLQNRRCDRAIWTGLGRKPRTRGPVRMRDLPSILVEFPSSRPADQRRDYEEKRIEYRDLGIVEYWIVDRFKRTMTVYTWRGKRWVKKTMKEGERYTTPLLPGFEVDLGRLLAISDSYDEGALDYEYDGE
jgi:Uma2 family endonuclease